MPEGLRNLALRDGLITPPDVAEYQHLFQGKEINKTTFQHYLEQPFMFNFAAVQLSMMCIKDGRARRLNFFNPVRERRLPWYDNREARRGVAPYKGMDISLVVGC